MPILYIIGFVVLAGAMFFLWRNPPDRKLATQAAGKVDTMQAQVAALRDTVTKLEQQKPPAPGPTTAEFQGLQQQVAALASRPAGDADQIPQLQQQIAALAARPGVSPEQLALLAQQVQARPEPNLEPLTQRIAALEQRPAFDPASLDPKFNQLATQLGQLTTQLGQVTTQVGQLGERLQQSDAKADAAATKSAQAMAALQARVDDIEKQQKLMAQRAALATKLQAAAAALAVGQKLGPIPGAPPALARFADQPPPTEASLRQSFDKYAADAQAANQPAATENEDFASRMWNRAQQAVTVRQGDRVLVGDPLAGIIAHARDQLDSGNLAGAVATMKQLTGPAAAAIQPWLANAQALLDARAAIATMAAG